MYVPLPTRDRVDVNEEALFNRVDEVALLQVLQAPREFRIVVGNTDLVNRDVAQVVGKIRVLVAGLL